MGGEGGGGGKRRGRKIMGRESGGIKWDTGTAGFYTFCEERIGMGGKGVLAKVIVR